MYPEETARCGAKQIISWHSKIHQNTQTHTVITHKIMSNYNFQYSLQHFLDVPQQLCILIMIRKITSQIILHTEILHAQ